MAIEWDAEGGVDGSGSPGALTNGNSGLSGFAMSSSIPTGTTVEYSTAAALDGTLGLAFTRLSGSTGFYVQQQVGSTTATPRKRQRCKVRFTSWPSEDVQIMNMRNSANGQTAYVVVDTSGRFVVKNSAGVTVWTSAALTLGTKYRLEFAVKPGSTTTTGAIDAAYYVGNSTVPVETPAALTGVNCGTDPTVLYNRWGRGGDSWVGNYHMDTLAYDSEASGLIGPAAPEPPVLRGVSFPVDSRAAGGSAPVKVSGSTLAFTTVVPGVFLFTQGSSSAVYSFDGANVTIPAVSASVYVPKRWSGTANDYV